MRAAAVCLVAALTPPVWIAATGGAEVDWLGRRIELFDALGPGLALGAALLAALLPAPRTRGAAWLRGAALLAAAVAAAVSWTEGFESDWIRVRRADRAGLLALVLAVASVRRGFAARPAVAAAAAGLLLGATATVIVRAADRAELAARIAAPAAGAEGPDVVFLLVDTLRADALGLYGAEPSPSPFLDRLGREAVVFERALAQAHWTVPSVSSLLSGLHPSSYFAGRSRPRRGIVRLPAGLPWLPERLRAAGLHTAGFAKNPYLQPGSRFEHGFDVFEYVRGDTAEGESAAQLVDAALVWADVFAERRAAGAAGRFFLYVHFMEPHVEYRPPPAFRPGGDYDGPVDGGVRSIQRMGERAGGPRPGDLARARALYRGEVAYVDAEIRRLHDRLADLGLWRDDTVVVLVSDHGEQFYEHGGFLHEDVYWENLHVPLVLRAPGLAPRRVAELVALVDLAPTLLDLLGLAPFAASEGRSLLPWLAGAPNPRPYVVSEHVARRRDTVRVTGPDGAVALGEAEQWYEDAHGGVVPLDAVPPEARDALARLAREVARFRERTPPPLDPGAEEPDLEPLPGTEERLRALGYVE